MRTTEIFTGGYYHIYNRGVDKRTVFESYLDFERFYGSMAVFNDIHYVDAQTRSFKESVENVRHRVSNIEGFVDILSFCLLPNHYHMFLRQRVDDGLAKFMQKLQMGYTKYFNLKNERSGSLFQGPYQSVAVTRQAQFEHLPCYIHLNALDLVDKSWRNGALSSTLCVLQKLSEHKWSSHNQYMEEQQDLPVVIDGACVELFGSKWSYMEAVTGWATRDCSTLSVERGGW